MQSYVEGDFMIEVKNVCKFYETKNGEVKALDNVNLSFPNSGLFFVLGKSGCGKTTLLNIIGGLDNATAGEILVDGKPIGAIESKDGDLYRNYKVGFVFQEYNLIDKETVKYNIELALELQGIKERERLVSKALANVGLTGYESRTIGELSGGQKQRVAIARALVKSPQIILADEPTGNLDSATSDEIYKLLKCISKDKLVIVVSHDTESAEQYADRIIKLKDGKVVGDEIKKFHESVTTHEGSKVIGDRLTQKSGRLHFGSMIKLAFRNFRKRWFRMSVTTVLFVCALAVFGLFVALLGKNPYERYRESYLNAGLNQFAFFHRITDEDGSYMLHEMSDEFIDQLFDESGHDFIRTYDADIIQLFKKNFSFDFENEHMEYYITRPRNISVIDEAQMRSFGYKFVGEGRLPNNGEYGVCLTKYLAESIMAFDKIWCLANGVNKLNDFVGKELNYHGNLKLTITGIIDTNVYGGYDHLKYLSSSEKKGHASEYAEFKSFVENTVHDSILVTPDFYENYLMVEPNISMSFIKQTESVLTETLADLSDDDITWVGEPLERLSVDMILLSPEMLRLYVMSSDFDPNAEKFYMTTSIRVSQYTDVYVIENKRLEIVGYLNDTDAVSVISDDAVKLNTGGLKLYSVNVRFSDAAADRELCSRLQLNRLNSNFITEDVVGEHVRIVNNSIEFGKEICIGFTVALVVVTAMMMFNLISITINDSKKQMGILRSLGMNIGDIFTVYLIEVIVISLIAAALACALAAIMSAVITPVIVGETAFVSASSVMPIGVWAVIAIFVMGITIAIASSAIPVFTKIKKAPIDLLK